MAITETLLLRVELTARSIVMLLRAGRFCWTVLDLALLVISLKVVV